MMIILLKLLVSAVSASDIDKYFEEIQPTPLEKPLGWDNLKKIVEEKMSKIEDKVFYTEEEMCNTENKMSYDEEGISTCLNEKSTSKNDNCMDVTDDEFNNKKEVGNALSEEIEKI